MEIPLTTKTTVKATHIRVTFEVDEEDLEENIPHDFPGMGPIQHRKVVYCKTPMIEKFAVITLTLNLDTHKVEGWPEGREEDIYVKVCDSGKYELLDGATVIGVLENYVPACIPNAYGDYIAMDIDGDGVVYDNGMKETWDPIDEDVQDAFFGEEK